jgi:hypothetical protein
LNASDSVPGNFVYSSTVGTVFSAGTQPWCVVFTPTNTNDLRNYIKATVGFPELVERTHTPKNGLMRMFSPRGNRRTLFRE